MTFGEKLLELREAAGLTEEALAAKSLVTISTIHGYEIGRRWPSSENVVALANALGTDCRTSALCDDLKPDHKPAEESEPAPDPPTEAMRKKPSGGRA